MQYIVHEDPVGRAESNYIGQADLAPFDLDGQVEQLWVRSEEDGTYALACIPFMAYGLALGDRARVSPAGRVVSRPAERPPRPCAHCSDRAPA